VHEQHPAGLDPEFRELVDESRAGQVFYGSSLQNSSTGIRTGILQAMPIESGAVGLKPNFS
jgi:hypothetical protein